MLYTYYGKPTNPSELDNFLTDNNLYTKGNLWTPKNVSKWLSTVSFNVILDCSIFPAPIDGIKKSLDKGHPLFLWLMNEGVKHSVLAVGYEGNQIIVNDPWHGDTVIISNRWGDSELKILEVDYYTGTLPITPTPPADRRDYWFDRINTVTFKKPHEQITDAEVEKFVREYPTQLARIYSLGGVGLSSTITRLQDEIATLKAQLLTKRRDTLLEVEKKLEELA